MTLLSTNMNKPYLHLANGLASGRNQDTVDESTNGTSKKVQKKLSLLTARIAELSASSLLSLEPTSKRVFSLIFDLLVFFSCLPLGLGRFSLIDLLLLFFLMLLLSYRGFYLDKPTAAY